MWRRPTTFRYDVTVPDLPIYIGRSVKVKDDDGKEHVVEIERLTGCVAEKHKTKLQVDANEKSYVISALDFFAQMNGESVTAEEIALFDETALEIKKNPWVKKKGILKPH